MADTSISQVTQNQVGFAPEVAPYAQNLLGTAAGVAYTYQKDPSGNIMKDDKGLPIISGFQPYQQYQGERVAQFSPLQRQSFEGAQNMQPAYQLQGATGLAGLAGQQALGTQYNPLNFRSQSITGGGRGMGGYGGDIGVGGLGGERGVGFDDRSGDIGVGYGGGMGGPQNTLQQYMSPYMQNVVQRQQQDASRQSAIAGQAQQAQAARMGAFGGSGDYLMRAQAAGNLARQKGDIQATGLQNAYGQALQQFNTEQQARQQAAQLGEQSRQYGAGLGLQGLQTALSGANTLGTLGQNQYNQSMGINQMQNQYGGQQQQQMNTILGNQYQDFLNQQNQPYKQLGFMSDIIRGAPLSQQGSTVYSANPTTAQNVASLGLGAAGVAKLGSLFAKGGHVKSNGLGGLALNKLV
jgi:hypothetical protein